MSRAAQLDRLEPRRDQQPLAVAGAQNKLRVLGLTVRDREAHALVSQADVLPYLQLVRLSAAQVTLLVTQQAHGRVIDLVDQPVLHSGQRDRLRRPVKDSREDRLGVPELIFGERSGSATDQLMQPGNPQRVRRRRPRERVDNAISLRKQFASERVQTRPGLGCADAATPADEQRRMGEHLELANALRCRLRADPQAAGRPRHAPLVKREHERLQLRELGRPDRLPDHDHDRTIAVDSPAAAT